MCFDRILRQEAARGYPLSLFSSLRTRYALGGIRTASKVIWIGACMLERLLLAPSKNDSAGLKDCIGQRTAICLIALNLVKLTFAAAAFPPFGIKAVKPETGNVS